MKKRHLIFGSLALIYFNTKSQSRDTSTIKVNETEIEFLYNQYIQDGNNSAVTGGIGTEKLIVYGPSLTVKRKFGSNAIDIQVGGDVVSSASTDNIDFIKSSASILDTRYFVNASYNRDFPKKNMSLNGGIGFSLESDYYSFGKFLGFSRTSKNEMQDFNLQIQIFNDDLRWRNVFFKPTNLIYPSELRKTEWFDTYRRNSYNLNFAYSRVLDKRNVLGIFSILSFQQGLLSTPFHRIYFEDESLAIEKLPDFRYKTSLGIKWNTFIGGMVIMRNTINGYADNFGILAFSVENETAFKINSQWTLTPNFRYYMQSASDYFAGYKEHNPENNFYTSDYDMSNMKTYNVGLGVKHRPQSKTFSELTFSYNFYTRSNVLKAHIMSLLTNFKIQKKEKK